MKLFNAFILLIVVTVASALFIFSLAVVAYGIEQNRISFILFGIGMAFMAVGYYHRYHPTKPWHPGFLMVLVAIGLAVSLVALLVRNPL